MAGLQLFTRIGRHLLALVAVPIFLLIGFGKVFGKVPPNWATWTLILLLLGWVVLWSVGTVRLVRSIRAERA